MGNLEVIAHDKAQIVALVGFEDEHVHFFFETLGVDGRTPVYFDNGLKLVQEWKIKNLEIVAIISNSEILDSGGLSLLETLKNKQMANVPFFMVVKYFNANLRVLALKAGVADVFRLPIDQARIEKRVTFFINNWFSLNEQHTIATTPAYKIGFAKRLFDLFFAGLALICLSPLFIIVWLLIRLESKGPAFYYSMRSGTGFKIFKFYKFRSMYVDADQKIKDLKHLNQYDLDQAKNQVEEVNVELCDFCKQIGKCKYPVYADGAQWCEKDDVHAHKSGSAFFKIANDPRITKIGNFIRNTSIDELPQLWNVIKGDMSIVGNRPLPIYEAEKLTMDKYALRFVAPAGLTGLWQVEKRGKGDMSEEERLKLDNTYAKNQSFKNDIKLIIRTIPALFQKENV